MSNNAKTREKLMYVSNDTKMGETHVSNVAKTREKLKYV